MIERGPLRLFSIMATPYMVGVMSMLPHWNAMKEGCVIITAGWFSGLGILPLLEIFFNAHQGLQKNRLACSPARRESP